jgi:hypothetical protein
MSTHLYPLVRRRGPASVRLDLLVLAEELPEGALLQVSLAGHPAARTHQLVLDGRERLDILLMGETVHTPGVYRWDARVPGHPAHSAHVTIELSEQELSVPV